MIPEKNNPMNIHDKRPSLFQRTPDNIWTDPYIRAQMLKAHLDPDSDGASRNSRSIDKIVSFVDSQIDSRDSFLDLGCGPGLYARRFRDLGYRVTGVDFNETAIEYAIGQDKDITYLYRDYIEQYPEGKYDAAVMIYCDMGTHSDQDRDELLTAIYRSLNDGGKLIFDVFSTALTEDKTEGSDWSHSPTGGFWSPEEYLLLSQTFHYPENRAFAFRLLP